MLKNPWQPGNKDLSFTLVELVVAISVIALLIALVIPVMARARERQARSYCLSNIRQIGLAFKQYSIDGLDFFPPYPYPVGVNPYATSSSVFLGLTNGHYLHVGSIYVCPLDRSRRPGTVNAFGISNNSYACSVADLTGRTGLTEAVTSDNPMVFDRGLAGAPGWIKNLTNATWLASSPHGTDGGNIFYADGRSGFKNFFDTGKDGTNGFVLEP